MIIAKWGDKIEKPMTTECGRAISWRETEKHEDEPEPRVYFYAATITEKRSLGKTSEACASRIEALKTLQFQTKMERTEQHIKECGGNLMRSWQEGKFHWKLWGFATGRMVLTQYFPENEYLEFFYQSEAVEIKDDFERIRGL